MVNGKINVSKRISPKVSLSFLSKLWGFSEIPYVSLVLVLDLLPLCMDTHLKILLPLNFDDGSHPNWRKKKRAELLSQAEIGNICLGWVSLCQMCFEIQPSWLFSKSLSFSILFFRFLPTIQVFNKGIHNFENVIKSFPQTNK